MITTLAEPSELTRTIASYGVSTDYELLPDHVRDYTKRVILDCLGSMILGSSMPVGAGLSSYVASMQATGAATVIGAGIRAPAPMAALVNGTTGHADELDPVVGTTGHLPVVAVATALAATEARSLGGREFINGVVLAYDVSSRLVSGLGGRSGLMDTHHIHTAEVHTIGAAVAAARILGLGVEETQQAMGLAAFGCSAPLALMDEGEHMTKAMAHGQAASAGLTGAMLAALGIRGNERILDANHGLVDVWRTPATDVRLFTAGLGTEFEVLQTYFKYFYGGHPIHAPLSGALQLMKAHGLVSEQISRIHLGLTTENADIVDGRAMPSISILDMVSLGISLGHLTRDDALNPERMNSDEVRRLKSIIHVVRDPELDAIRPAPMTAWVEIQTQDGKTYRVIDVAPPGDYRNGGMPWQDVFDKFDGLVAPRLGAAASASIRELIRDLETMENLSELGTLLQGATAEPDSAGS